MKQKPEECKKSVSKTQISEVPKIKEVSTIKEVSETAKAQQIKPESPLVEVDTIKIPE